MLDVNELAKSYAYYRATGLSVSPDNRFLSYGVDTLSRRKYTIFFKDLETGDLLADRIFNTTGGTVWANDNKHLFYSTKDSTLRSHMIWRHKLGTDPSQDRMIHHESDNTFSTYVYKSKSQKYIFIGSGSTLSSEIRFLNADNPEDKFKIIQKRGKDYKYSVSHYRDKFYIVTNHKAKNFRLMKTPVNKKTKRHWKAIPFY